MSKSNFIPLLGLGLICVIAPLMQQPTKVMSKDTQGVVNTQFRLVIDNIVESKSGLAMCKMTVKDTDKQVVGPCETTDGTKLQVGYTYTVNRAKFDGTFISINSAIAAESPIKWEVTSTYVAARTPLMIVRNGGVEKVVGNNEDHVVGSFVSID
jgi:hypothetical protein